MKRKKKKKNHPWRQNFCCVSYPKDIQALAAFLREPRKKLC